ncbi:1-deoxy-D-xylulose-5-phosphate synthase, partial [Streptomyces lavendulae]
RAARPGGGDTVDDTGPPGGGGAACGPPPPPAGVDVPLRDFGIPQRFLDHALRKEIMAEIGLTAPDIARQVTGLVAKLDGRFENEPAATVD